MLPLLFKWLLKYCISTKFWMVKTIQILPFEDVTTSCNCFPSLLLKFPSTPIILNSNVKNFQNQLPFIKFMLTSNKVNYCIYRIYLLIL